MINIEDMIIDKEDIPIVGFCNWHLHKCGKKTYIRNAKRVYLHRLIMGAPENMDVDHINGNSLDNRRQNLRICERKHNCYNKKSVRGYWYDKSCNKYRAEIWFENRKYYLGVYRSEDEARSAYIKKAKELFGAFYHDRDTTDQRRHDAMHFQFASLYGTLKALLKNSKLNS